MKGTDRTLKKKKAFLLAYPAEGTVTHAARMARIDRRTVYKWLDDDTEFASAFEEAREAAADTLEREAIRRAAEGVPEPVYYRGERIDTVRRYSDTLLIFLLKGLRPTKFNDHVVQEHVGREDQPVHLRVTGLSREEIRELLEEAKRGGHVGAGHAGAAEDRSGNP